ncbi:unnamed protein product, partial [Urochloa humidicola]
EISPTPSSINPRFPSLLLPLPILSRRTTAPSARSWGRSRQRPTRDQGAARRSSSTCGRRSSRPPSPSPARDVRRSIWPAADWIGQAWGGGRRRGASARRRAPARPPTLLRPSSPRGRSPVRPELAQWHQRWMSRGPAGALAAEDLLPSAASMADLYPHHPLLRRWRCGDEMEHRRRSTSGVDLVVAKLRTSGGADLSSGGHLRRPPPQLLAGLHLIFSSPSAVPSRLLCSLPLLLACAMIAAEG